MRRSQSRIAVLLALVLALTACVPLTATPVATADVPAPAATPARAPAAAPSDTPAPTDTPAPGSSGRIGLPSPAPGLADVEAAILALVNEERVKQGLAPLGRSPHLDAVARAYAESQFAREVGEAGELLYLLSNSWWMTYGSGTPRLTAKTAPEQVTYCLEQEHMREALLRPEARATGIGAAVVGDAVYYTQVFDVLAGLKGDGSPIRLHENPEAVDPTWEELTRFLAADDTDAHAYEIGAFVCADYAEMLHNRAEQAGMRAAYVSVEFGDGPGHALNAFSVGGALVFIDTVGGDKVAYVEQGRPYGVVAIAAAAGFDYGYFERYSERVAECLRDGEAFDVEAAAYAAEGREYEAAVAAHNRKPTEAEYDRLTEWQRRLDDWHGRLDLWRGRLDACSAELALADGYWDPADSLEGVADPTVRRVYVHW